MGARSKARLRALDVLFEAEQRRISSLTVLQNRLAQGADGGLKPIPDYAKHLVEGVTAHRERIDELLSTYSQGWELARMPAVDRQILRIGVFELLWGEDLPDAVVVDEAVEMAKTMSTDESPSFVNGLLGRLVTLKPTLID